MEGRFVELAIDILRQKPTEQSQNLRDWATQVIDKYSGVTFSDSTKRDLIKSITISEKPSLGTALDAYCEVLTCSGIGRAANYCYELLPTFVNLAVPESMHDDFPQILLACVTKICTDEPYEWPVLVEEPTIDEKTTFVSLYSNWFLSIVSFK